MFFNTDEWYEYLLILVCLAGLFFSRKLLIKVSKDREIIEVNEVVLEEKFGEQEVDNMFIVLAAQRTQEILTAVIHTIALSVGIYALFIINPILLNKREYQMYAGFALILIIVIGVYKTYRRWLMRVHFKNEVIQGLDDMGLDEEGAKV